MSKNHSSRFLRLVDTAKATVPEFTVQQVRALLASEEACMVVDVREQDEWSAGHIEGAVHLSKGVIERDIEQAVPDTGTLMVLYCGGGFRSVLAAAALHAMGYSQAVSMAGGWREWCATKYTVRGPERS